MRRHLIAIFDRKSDSCHNQAAQKNNTNFATFNANAPSECTHSGQACAANSEKSHCSFSNCLHIRNVSPKTFHCPRHWPIFSLAVTKWHLTRVPSPTIARRMPDLSCSFNYAKQTFSWHCRWTNVHFDNHVPFAMQPLGTILELFADVFVLILRQHFRFTQNVAQLMLVVCETAPLRNNICFRTQQNAEWRPGWLRLIYISVQLSLRMLRIWPHAYYFCHSHLWNEHVSAHFLVSIPLLLSNNFWLKTPHNSDKQRRTKAFPTNSCHWISLGAFDNRFSWYLLSTNHQLEILITAANFMGNELLSDTYLPPYLPLQGIPIFLCNGVVYVVQ